MFGRYSWMFLVDLQACYFRSAWPERVVLEVARRERP
jgi:hypothetical protein